MNIMEFMGYHIVDIVIVGLVAFLAIKGLVNGFSKELLNFITIVAGVILAARYNTQVIEYINQQNLIPQIPEEFSKLAGFVLILLTIWLLMAFISSIITKVTSGPTGVFSRLLGYVLSAARYLFIFSLIIFGMSQADFFKKSTEKFNKEAKLFKPMAEIGAKILNIDINQTEQTNSDNNISAINKVLKPINKTVESNSSN
jgi:uncharacterized membrane protein required for colicin V production